MIHHIFRRRGTGSRRWRSRGQSLVEFALVLPILLLVVAATLEVGNVLTIYNRVQHAAREGARFAAAGGGDVRSIIDQSSREALEMDEDFMTVWVVRPTIVAKDASDNPLPPEQWTWQNASADLPWGVEEQCIFGDRCSSDPALPSQHPITPAGVLDDVREDMNTLSEPAEIDDTTFAVVTIFYEVDTILNLPFWQAPDIQAGRIPIWAYGIMAQQVEQEAISLMAGGCSAYPFAISTRAIPEDIKEGDTFRTYRNYYHTNDGSHFLDGVGFVSWNIVPYDMSSGGLTSANPSDHYGSVTASWVSLDEEWGFIEYLDEDDTGLDRGDWVLGLMDTETAVIQEDLRLFKEEPRHLRIFVYRNREDPHTGSLENPRLIQYDPGNGNWKPGMQYEVADFMIAQVKDYDHVSNPEWIEWQFIRWDASCGFNVDQYGPQLD